MCAKDCRWPTSSACPVSGKGAYFFSLPVPSMPRKPFLNSLPYPNQPKRWFLNSLPVPYQPKKAYFDFSEQTSHLFLLNEHHQDSSRLMLELSWRIWVIFWSAWFLCINGFRKEIYLKPKQRRWIGSVFERTVWCSFYSDTRDEAVLSSILSLWGLRLSHAIRSSTIIWRVSDPNDGSQGSILSNEKKHKPLFYLLYFFMISSFSLSYCAEVVWLSS